MFPESHLQEVDITFQFANAVRVLHRQGLTIPQISQRLMSSQTCIRLAHQVHRLLANGSADTLPLPNQAERDAMVDRMPKRVQDRLRRPG